MFRLHVAGPDTHVASSLCASCPHSPAGCCVAPPRMDWSDIGRVVVHGGREWLLEQVAAGNLVRRDFGLSLRRVKGRVTPSPRAPRIAKCVFHDGASGCTIDASRRPATCNFYVCESVYEDAGKEGLSASVDDARGVHDGLVASFVGWDAELSARIKASWPDGPAFDVTFLDWLGDSFARLAGLPGRVVTRAVTDAEGAEPRGALHAQSD